MQLCESCGTVVNLINTQATLNSNACRRHWKGAWLVDLTTITCSIFLAPESHSTHQEIPLGSEEGTGKESELQSTYTSNLFTQYAQLLYLDFVAISKRSASSTIHLFTECFFLTQG